MRNDLDRVLRMTARVMGVAALTACQVPSEGAPDDSTDPFDTTPTDSDPTPGTLPTDDSATVADDTGCPPPEVEIVEVEVEVDPRSPFEICEDQVNEAIVEETLDDDDLVCCTDLLDAESAAMMGGEPYTAGFRSWLQRSSCCSLLGDKGTRLACTPWGPQCPPSMQAVA